MTISRNIQQKMVRAALEAPSLKKEERNERAEFNFVGIDRFYSDIASLLHSMGIGWTTVEVGVDIQPIGDQVIVLQKFRFDVFDSESGDVAEGYSYLTIPAPFSDAQTAGISLSYADKAFMRTALKVVTGEKDADHFAKKKGSNKPPPAAQAAAELDPGPPVTQEAPPEAKAVEAKPEKKPAAKPKKADSEPAADEGDSEWKIVADRLIDILADIGDSAGLEQFRIDEQGEINKLKSAAAEGSGDAEAQKQRVQGKYGELYDRFEEEGEE